MQSFFGPKGGLQDPDDSRPHRLDQSERGEFGTLSQRGNLVADMTSVKTAHS